MNVIKPQNFLRQKLLFSNVCTIYRILKSRFNHHAYHRNLANIMVQAPKRIDLNV